MLSLTYPPKYAGVVGGDGDREPLVRRGDLVAFHLLAHERVRGRQRVNRWRRDASATRAGSSKMLVPWSMRSTPIVWRAVAMFW